MTEPEEIERMDAPREDAPGQEIKALEENANSEASEDIDEPSAPLLTQILAEAQAVHAQLETQQELLEGTRHEIQDVGEILLNQIAGLEKQSVQAVQRLEAQSAQVLSALEARVEAAEREGQAAQQRTQEAEARVIQAQKQQDVYKDAWQSAPLLLRLKFVRELLPEIHALQNMLKEATALEELRRRGRDLETWLSNYPALFADAAQALLSGGGAPALGGRPAETHPAEILATQTLQETRAALESTVRALGITWIAPMPGDPVQAEHEVTGEEPSTYGGGRVARLRRRGFRLQGRLALPAQVIRAAPSARPITIPVEHDQAADVPTAAPLSEQPADPSEESHVPTSIATLPEERESGAEQEADASGPEQHIPETTHQESANIETSGSMEESGGGDPPDWLRMLSQRTFGCELPAVVRLAEQIFALKELPGRIATEAEEAATRVLTGALQPLLPLLGLRYADGLADIPEEWGTVFLEARQPLLEWLDTRMHLSLVAPVRGDGFDAHTMEALETRRTVHAKEDETVAKLERIGVVWRNRPLILAQVVRYTTGGPA